MNIVFILSPLNSKESIELLELNKKKEITVFYESENYLSVSLINKLKCYSIYDQKIDLEEFNKRILQSVVDFGHLKINNQALATFLKLDGISYWYYLKFSLYQRSKKSLTQVFLIEKLIDHHKAKSDFVKIYSSQEKIKTQFGNEAQVIVTDSKSESNTNTTFLLKYFFIFFFRAVAGAFNYHRRNSRKAKTLVLTNVYNRQEIIDINSLKVIKGDPHLHYLLLKTLKNKKIQYLSQLRPPGKEDNHRLSISDYLSKTAFSKKTIYFEPFLLLSILSPSFYKKKKKLELIWTQLVGTIEKNSRLSGEELIIFESFKKLKKQLLLALWREEATKILINHLAIEKVVAIDEHSLQNKSIFNGFKQKKLKTIAIQHGAISQSNVAYKFSEKDLPFNPFADLTLIRGDYTRQMLIEQNYPKDKLKIVGHIRTDIIQALKSAPKQLNLFENDKPLILYATQPIPKTEQVLKEQFIKDFFRLCNEFPNYNFVLKPHPNESSLDDYLKYSKNNKYPNFKFYQGELYQLLASVDAVITYFSTVGLEAIYFKKPLLTIDYYQIDAQGYLKDGVSINSLDYQQLKENLKSIIDLKSSLNSAELEEFIENRVYKIDGKVAKRCLEYI